MEPSIGGYFNFEDPLLDARRAQPQWIPSPDSILRLTEADQLSNAIPFSLWRLPGRKSLTCIGGDQVLVSAQINQATFRMTLNNGVHEGAGFACSIPATRRMRAACSAACQIVDLFSGAALPGPCIATRPNRQALVHMRALQVLDGIEAGATHREVADAIFGESDTWQRWGQNSELRAQIRYLLRRGHALVNGGYRELLGEITARAEPP